jgi:hypothetical protein
MADGRLGSLCCNPCDVKSMRRLATEAARTLRG